MRCRLPALLGTLLWVVGCGSGPALSVGGSNATAGDPDARADGLDGSTGGQDASTGDPDGPAGGTDAMIVASDAPAGSADAPAGSADAPAGSADAPPGSTDAPPGSTDAPPGNVDAPAGGADAPAGSADVSSDPASADAGIPGGGGPAFGEICASDRWCWYNPLPQSYGLGAVWGAAPGELWVAPVTPGFVLHRSREGSWRREATAPGTIVKAFWGDSPSSVWAAGSFGDGGVAAAQHWDGVRWTGTPVPAATRELTDVGGSGPNDVWAVGRQDVLRFNGTAWAAVDMSPAVPLFLTTRPPRVAAVAPNDVWVTMDTQLLHWNGSAWTVEDAPAGVDDVWASGAGAVYRVRREFIDGIGTHPVVERRDGTAWVRVFEVALVYTDASPFARLSGSGPSDVWMVDPFATAYHFNGTAWATIATGPSMPLGGLWAEAAGSAALVGPAGEIRELEAGAFRRTTRGVQENLTTISGTDPKNVWFAGTRALVNWNGTDFLQVPLPPDMPKTEFGGSGPLAVWAPDPGTVWIGGVAGLLARRTGGAWQKFSVTTQSIHTIWGADATDAWAVGFGGPVLRWQAGAWSQAVVPFEFPTDVHGTARDDVWLTGSGGLAHWNGSDWTVVPGAPVGTMRVSATARNDVWLLGQTNSMTVGVHHFDGTTFTSLGSFYRMSFGGLWSPGPGELYLTNGQSDEGIPAGIMHVVSGVWQPPVENLDVYDLWGAGRGDIWTSGADGAILRRLAP